MTHPALEAAQSAAEARGEVIDIEVLLLMGVAVLLDEQTSARWPGPDEALLPDVTRIVLDHLPRSPDSVVALSTYGVTDDPSLSDSVIGLQVTTRRGGQDPLPVLGLTGQVFDALQGLHDVVLASGVHVVQCLRQSHTSTGFSDKDSRWRRVQNFYCTVHRPSPHRQ